MFKAAAASTPLRKYCPSTPRSKHRFLGASVPRGGVDLHAVTSACSISGFAKAANKPDEREVRRRLIRRAGWSDCRFCRAFFPTTMTCRSTSEPESVLKSGQAKKAGCRRDGRSLREVSQGRLLQRFQCLSNRYLPGIMCGSFGKIRAASLISAIRWNIITFWEKSALYARYS